MNRATKIIELPALTVDLLKANGVLIDNVFASLWRDIGMKTVLNRAGFTKRSVTSMSDVKFSLMLWLWLQKDRCGTGYSTRPRRLNSGAVPICRHARSAQYERLSNGGAFQVQVFRRHINFFVPHHCVVCYTRPHEQADCV